LAAAVISTFGLFCFGAFDSFLFESKPSLDFLEDDRVYEHAIGGADDGRYFPPDSESEEVEVSELMPRPDSIFFVESSGSSSVKPRIACAIESAAKLHPNSRVYVILTAPRINVRSVDHLTKSTAAYNNIHFRYLNVRAFLRGTPLEKLWRKKAIQTSKFAVSHLSDVLRYAILWRFGGTYVDTDVIFIKPLPSPASKPNLIGRERDDKPHLAAGIMRFEFGHPAMARMQQHLADNFDGNEWGANGPLAITQVLFDLCSSGNGSGGGDDDQVVTSSADMTPEKCLGVSVLEQSAFYAIPFWEWSDVFDENKTDQVMARLNQSIALHMWGRFSSAAANQNSINSAFDVIASHSCPVSYRRLSHQSR